MNTDLSKCIERIEEAVQQAKKMNDREEIRVFLLGPSEANRLNAAANALRELVEQ